MNGLYLVIISALVFVLAYRFYGAFIAAKVLTVNQYKVTPAFRFEDGHDYVPTNKYVVFGHHFAAIAGAGPLVGPVIAAQFGYLPGALWILIGGVLAGAVHDMVILFCSMRYDGKSIAEIAKAQIGDKTGLATSFAVLFLNIPGHGRHGRRHRQRPARQPLGYIYDWHDHPYRHLHRPLHAVPASWPH